jgi:hypothetical protein
VFTSALTLQAQTPLSFRVLLGVTDATPARWEGTITVREGGHYTIEGWRLDDTDLIDGDNFYLLTRPARIFDVPPLSGGTGRGAVAANGFVLNLDAATESTEILVTTSQGDFHIRPSEATYGTGKYVLNGRVYVDRVPPSSRLTKTTEGDEADYPSMAAGPDGEVWLAYVQFTPNPDYAKLRTNISKPPGTFALWAAPTGGDQIWARRYSHGSWEAPIAVTKPGGDLYRTAVAVDGSRRAWIFWSENDGGNFDIFARALDSSGPKEQIQISKEVGSDIDPVAVTDASGRVWVAWQGWRDGVAAIFAAHQSSNGFTAPEKISSSDKNEWNPAIAADRNGRVAVAWDSYRNANYDIYERTWEANSWSTEVAIAATLRYEAYPSLAFDPNGCLWIAYEEGGLNWAKDFGTYSTTGVSVYLGRLVKLRGLQPNGRLVALHLSPDSALTGPPSLRADAIGSQMDSESLDPNPDIALHRDTSRLATNGALNYDHAAKNSLPRLLIDRRGRIWLAFRTAHPIWWSPGGFVWTENLISFDGSSWSKPIFINHTDNLLDNRPALVSIADGSLLMVNSSDGRRQLRGSHFQNDLWTQMIDLGPGRPVTSGAVEGVVERKNAAEGRPEADAIRVLRSYRNDANLRILRGEFHRHSDVSGDGNHDGALLDQWRYILDAAGLDWVGCCDHDNGNREYTWWIIQKQTDIFHTPGKFVPMFSYERSVNYPEGHRNVVFAQRGIRPLPRLPISDPLNPVHAPDTQMLYAYLREFKGIAASHTSATMMGTDWRDNDPNSEPLVEIYQGDRQSYEMPGSPRSNSEKDAPGEWRPKGYVSVALEKGYRLGFEASSDHVSTHISYANVYVKEATRESVLEALKSRHVYASTDNILADVESGSHMMGDEFSTSELPSLKIKLRGTSRFAKVSIVRNGKYVYSSSPNTQEVNFSWRDNQPEKGKTSYYYVRGEQDDGELVWISPLWIRYTGQ